MQVHHKQINKMSSTENESKEIWNNLEFRISPSKFVKMFTIDKCTYEDKIMQEILNLICALRNSGGGRLTIFLLGTLFESDVKKCSDIITNAINETLSGTGKEDFLSYNLSNKIAFLVNGSKEIITVKYNMYIIGEDGDAKLMPSKKSAKEVRSYLFNPNQTPVSQVTKRKYQDSELNEIIRRQKLPINCKHSKENVMFRYLEKKFSDRPASVESRITLEKNKLLQCVSALANYRGGELYYCGVDSRGYALGEKIPDKEDVEKEVEKAIGSMTWPKHVNDKSKFWNIQFVRVDEEIEKVGKIDAHEELYVIKINVSPCHDGVFIKDPESYHVVENRAEKISFLDWLKCLQNSKTMISEDRPMSDFAKDTEFLLERIFLQPGYENFLRRLEWVRNVRVVDQNEECDKRHLEIVCEYRKVPRIADIVKYFGQSILPFITYRECSKREWFESNIFNEYSDLCDKYENELSSLPWVKEYYIDVANEPEKSWQIYIICEKNKIPSMKDLKKLFGVNIASFVDFCQENVDENSETNEESLLQSFSREPISSDEQLVQEEEEQEEEEEEQEEEQEQEEQEEQEEYDSLGMF
ncbi:uncharacterized protein LOC114525955 [Dendronephthya gigantea]|uniref:uncharacterized protein LOC114525955 n=1 Tax=Dendronephthya gigantea TaxID=151771 RepID=UPI00106D24FA|nr:uncharacterized protein LOC114525955 [Dendronephthya gigantea]